MSFTLVAEGFPELRRAMSYGVQVLVGDMRRAGRDAGDAAVERIKSDAPVKTGHLREQTRLELRSVNGGMSGAVVVGTDYASHVKDGTYPHWIVGRGKKLKFDIDGTTHFRVAVNHPGTRPNDFVTPGINAGMGVLVADAVKAVRKLKARIEG